MNAKTYLKSIVYNTPKWSGATRAGYWPAWNALGMSGSPGTRRSFGKFKMKKSNNRTYIPDGYVIDERNNRREKVFVFVNKTHHISDKTGKKTYYPYEVNQRQDFWGKGAEEAAFKFGRAYEKLLRKHSKL
jgi:hypothetical protein